MYDLIVIGGGPGGYAAAEFAARHGMTVALAEKDRLGGTCLQRGCIPTKAYLHASGIAHEATRYAPQAVAAFDRHAMYTRKNEVVDTLTGGIASTLKAAKVTVVEGRATLTGSTAPFAVTVANAAGETQTLTGQKVLLATGSAPARLPVPGCDNPAVWTSDDLLGEPGTEPFQSLLIVGGGVIGVEMASVYARLGVAVTILEAENRCLPMLDTELGRSVEMLLKSMGVTVLTGARLKNLAQTGEGFTAGYEKNGTPRQATCQRALLATGRVPVTDGLFTVQPEMNRRFIAVDARYRTSLEGVYAIGDVNGQWQLAHAAHAQGLAAVCDMLGLPTITDPLLAPACVYTTPEIATVGLTQDAAKAQGLETVTGKAPTTQYARTLIEGLGRGFIKLVFDKQTRRLLGAQLFCGRATDIVGELAMAIQNGLTAQQMLAAMRPHPTFEEAVTAAVMAARFE